MDRQFSDMALRELAELDGSEAKAALQRSVDRFEALIKND